MDCRFCGSSFLSRSQCFKHLRSNPACLEAAATEDKRATDVISTSQNGRAAAAFLVRWKGGTDAAEACLTRVLESSGVGATSVTARCASADGPFDAIDEQERCEPFVAMFAIPAAPSSVEQVLHHMHLAAISPCLAPLASAKALGFQLLHTHAFPPRNKASFEELCASDWTDLLPSSDYMCQEPLWDQPLADLVTVIVTTSPMRSDPELGVLEIVIASLKLAGLEECRKVLVCDHLEADEGGAGNRAHAKDRKKQGLKLGHVPSAHLARYRERLRMFRAAKWASGVEVLELESWHGFSRATERALAEVRTPLVCVIQHDLAFLRPVRLDPVAGALMQCRVDDNHVHCVTFPRYKQRDYATDLRLRTGLRVGSPCRVQTEAGVVALTRLPQFLDGTHIARTDWYRSVYQRARHEQVLRPLLRRGAFQELTLGAVMLKLAKHAPEAEELKEKAGAEMAEEMGDGSVSKGVLRVCAEFGNWLWHPEDGRGHLIFHLDSGKHYAAWEQHERGLPPSPLLDEYRAAVSYDS